MQGRIPPHRTDSGAFLTAEVLGAKRCVLVKDERGLFSADPKKDPEAEFIPNGREPGTLAGENPGTRIYREA